MTPEQLLKLRELRKLFAEGSATPENIRQLSELLASINHQSDADEFSFAASQYNPRDDI